MDRSHTTTVRNARVVLLVVGCLLLAVVAVVGVTAATLPACGSCHGRDSAFREATASTAHAQADAACVSCHVRTRDPLARVKLGFYEVFGMWMRLADVSGSDVGLVSDAQCRSCHAKIDEVVTEARGLRINHVACASDSACVDCHSALGHGDATRWPRSASMNDCVLCHQQMKTSVECVTCHTDTDLPDRPEATEFRMTHGPTWRKTHGMGRMSTCSVCHREDACLQCHGPGVPHDSGFLMTHAQVATQPGAACTSCHDDAFCYDCHQTEMPHSRLFTETHAAAVNETGEGPCMRCHLTVDCTGCHTKHVHPGGAVGRVPSPELGGD